MIIKVMPSLLQTSKPFVINLDASIITLTSFSKDHSHLLSILIGLSLEFSIKEDTKSFLSDIPNQNVFKKMGRIIF